MASIIRQNYNEECEALINKQINMELSASYVYLSMSTYFDRDDVALKGFSKFFEKCSLEEREHATKFINYQNKRGGRVVFHDIQKPPKNDWNSALDAVKAALEYELAVNKSLLALHEVATKHNDPQMCDFIESEYLQEQVDAQKELGDLISQMKRVGEGVGLHIIDKELQDKN